VPSDDTQHVQEAQLVIMHLLADLVDRAWRPDGHSDESDRVASTASGSMLGPSQSPDLAVVSGADRMTAGANGGMAGVATGDTRAVVAGGARAVNGATNGHHRGEA